MLKILKSKTKVHGDIVREERSGRLECYAKFIKKVYS